MQEHRWAPRSGVQLRYDMLEWTQMRARLSVGACSWWNSGMWLPQSLRGHMTGSGLPSGETRRCQTSRGIIFKPRGRKHTPNKSNMLANVRITAYLFSIPAQEHIILQNSVAGSVFERHKNGHNVSKTLAGECCISLDEVLSILVLQTETHPAASAFHQTAATQTACLDSMEQQGAFKASKQLPGWRKTSQAVKLGKEDLLQQSSLANALCQGCSTWL